jgi:tetratricopeptide (TPR) repeat protein
MKKSAIVLFFAAFLSVSAFAQSVQDGVNHLYAQRYQSAKEVFDKLLAANPNNMEAVYWAGQSLLDQDDVAGAKAIYEKALAANGNAPWALVGMGHVELLEGKANEARQRFETAISLSKGKKANDPNILTAVGRANSDAFTDKDKKGDLEYAIAKLNEAAGINANNAETFLVLGNAYRKAHNGGQAVVNYAKARTLNPSFAMPSYRMAKLYQTQQNWDIVLEHLNNAVAADPKFAPAYQDLYYYYLLYPKDFAKAEDYANKYIANADKTVDIDYIKAQTAFVQNKFDEAIAVAKNIATQAGDKTRPVVYRLLGYSYVGKGDSTTACQYVGQFFAKAKEEDVIGQDYILQADACGKDNPDIVRASYYKAATMDSVLSKQVNLLNEGIERFRKAGNKLFEGDLRLLSYQLRGTQANPAELFQIGVPYYQAGVFDRADSIFKAYSTAFPDSVYGYLWSARSLGRIDSTMEQGIAIPQYEQLLRVAETDKVRYKSYGLEAVGNLAQYYVNVKKDKDKGVTYLRKGLEFDPENTTFKRNIEILSKPAPTTKAAGNKG